MEKGYILDWLSGLITKGDLNLHGVILIREAGISAKMSKNICDNLFHRERAIKKQFIKIYFPLIQKV